MSLFANIFRNFAHFTLGLGVRVLLNLNVLLCPVPNANPCMQHYQILLTIAAIFAELSNMGTFRINMLQLPLKGTPSSQCRLLQ